MERERDLSLVKSQVSQTVEESRHLSSQGEREFTESEPLPTESSLGLAAKKRGRGTGRGNESSLKTFVFSTNHEQTSSPPLLEQRLMMLSVDTHR